MNSGNDASRGGEDCGEITRRDSSSGENMPFGSLLGAVFIICAIITMLLPMFVQAREKAHQGICTSNLRQLGVAFLQYAQDNDQTLPGAYRGPEGDGERLGGWVAYDDYPVNAGANAFAPGLGVIYPYVRSTQVFVCPDDLEGKRTGDSYAVNSCTLRPVDAEGLYPGKPLAEFASPLRIMLLGEDASPSILSSSTDDGFFRYQSDVFSVRHSSGSNVLLLDGEIKWYPAGDGSPAGLQSQTPTGADCPP